MEKPNSLTSLLHVAALYNVGYGQGVFYIHESTAGADASVEVLIKLT